MLLRMRGAAALRPPGGADAAPRCCLIVTLRSCISVSRSAQGQIPSDCLVVCSVVRFSDGEAAAQGHFERLLHLTAPQDGIRSAGRAGWRSRERWRSGRLGEGGRRSFGEEGGGGGGALLQAEGEGAAGGSEEASPRRDRPS